MDLTPLFRSIIEQDTQAVVVCDPEHRILYMNPAAIAHYSRFGGADLIGKRLLDCHNSHSNELIQKVTDWFAADSSHNIVFTASRPEYEHEQYMVALRDEQGRYIGYYEKHETRRYESAMTLFDLPN